MDGAASVRGTPSASFGASRATSSAPSLAALLQQSRKLTTHQARSELPQIQLGLDQIENQSRRLVAKAAGLGGTAAAAAAAANAPGAVPDAKAHYFLAGGGIDASDLAETIDAANIANAFEPLQPIHDADVESYLRHSHEQILLAAIEDGRRQTLADFRKRLARTMVNDWDRSKRRIYEELGQHRPLVGSAAWGGDASKVSSQAQLRNDAPSLSGPSALTMHARMMRYDPVVARLNQHRLDAQPFALAHAMADSVAPVGVQLSAAAVEGPHSVGAQLVESWRVVACLVGEADVSNGEFRARAVHEREYAAAYAHVGAGARPEAWRAAEVRDLRKRLIAGASAFLERQFSEHIDATIASDPVKAQLGGNPSTLARVAAFLRVIHLDREERWTPELEVVRTSSGPLPIWAVLFYLLRTGHSGLALEFAAEHEEILRKLDGGSVGGGGGLVPYMKAWLDSPDRMLPKHLRDRFVAEYNTRFRGAGDYSVSDGYKLGLYKLLGRIDVTKRFPPVLTRSTENWLWLQLALIREPGGGGGGADASFSLDAADFDSARDRYTLHDLGAKLLSYGEAHFDPKGNRPLHYFQILLLCGQFERAIAFLYSRPQFQVDAVHFALTLAYYGLLRVPEAAKTSHIDYLTLEATPDGDEVALLDFAKLVQRYVRLFARSDARSALQYLYLVCLGSDCPEPVGSEQRRKCHDLVRQLVLDTRQYLDLLGDVRSDGTKVPGVIERNLRLLKLSDSSEFLTRIVSTAAAQSASDHRTRDAILLYNIAEEYDTVLDVLNRELSAGLFEPPAVPAHAVAGGGGGGGEGLATGKLQAGASLSAAQDTAQLARAILESYERQGHIARALSPRRREACRLLLSLKRCVALFSAGEYERCLHELESLDLVPLSGDGVSITRRAEQVRELDESVSRNMGQLLLLAMETLFKLHSAARESGFGDASRHQLLERLRAKARALMMYAGLLRLRIESGVYAQLTRLDVYLH